MKNCVSTRVLTCLAILNLVFMVACFPTCSVQASDEGHEEDKIPLFVSIEPQAYFVERIAKERVDVNVLLPPGKSPATYAPTPSQMIKLAKAKLFFSIGVPFEKAVLPKIRNLSTGLSIVDTVKGIELMPFDSLKQDHENGDDAKGEQVAEGHRHDNEKGHGEEESGKSHHRHHSDTLDPHTWMSPRLVKIQAANIMDALIAVAPGYEAEFKHNYEQFVLDLESLDVKIRSALLPVKGEMIFVYHPVFGYFARDYGLKQFAVERAGKSPKGKELGMFITEARKRHVRVIFVQPQFDRNVAQKVAAAIQGVVIPLDPLKRDYITNLENMALTVEQALSR